MNEVNESSTSPVAPESLIPENHIVVPINYSFRRFEDTPENREKQLQFADANHEIDFVVAPAVDDDGKETGKIVFKRTTETVQLVLPTAAALGFAPELDSEGVQTTNSAKQEKVLQAIITGAVESLGRKIVNQGITVTNDNCSWPIAMLAEYDRLSSAGTSAGGVTYGKDYLQEIVDMFAAYMKNIDKPEAGILAQSKMIKARFNRMSTAKYINGLDMVAANIEEWFTQGLDEADQATHLEVVQYLLEKCETAKTPEVVETGELF